MGKVIEKSVAEIIVIGIFLMILLSSCGTWKWVEPIGPSHANNHRHNVKMCR